MIKSQSWTDGNIQSLSTAGSTNDPWRPSNNNTSDNNADGSVIANKTLRNVKSNVSLKGSCSDYSIKSKAGDPSRSVCSIV